MHSTKGFLSHFFLREFSFSLLHTASVLFGTDPISRTLSWCGVCFQPHWLWL